MILLGSQVGTPAIWSAGSNFDTMRALKSMPLRYCNVCVRVLFFREGGDDSIKSRQNCINENLKS